jgi:hypothetical protein
MGLGKFFIDRTKGLEAASKITSIIASVAATIAAVVLGLMAHRVSVNSNTIGEAQLRVAEQGLSLNRAAARPRFRAVPRRCSGPLETDEYYDCVELWNDGPPARNWTFLQVGFLEVSSVNSAVPADPEVWSIPVYYFFDRQITGREQGLLATFGAYRSPEYFGERFNATSFWEKLEGDLRAAGFHSRLRIFLYVAFVDALGLFGEDALEIHPAREGVYFGSGGSGHLTDQAQKLMTVGEIPWLDELSVEGVRQRIHSGKTYDLNELFEWSKPPEASSK